MPTEIQGEINQMSLVHMAMHGIGSKLVLASIIRGSGVEYVDTNVMFRYISHHSTWPGTHCGCT